MDLITLHTGQFSYRGHDRIDITLKGLKDKGLFMGPGRILVPTRDLDRPDYELVGGVKHWMMLNEGGELDDDRVWVTKFPAISPDEYTARYMDILRHRYARDPDLFIAVLMLPGNFFLREEATLCCYCSAGTFCHRHIAKEVLGRVALRHGIAAINGGERAARSVASPLLVEQLL